MSSSYDVSGRVSKTAFTGLPQLRHWRCLSVSPTAAPRCDLSWVLQRLHSCGRGRLAGPGACAYGWIAECSLRVELR